MPELWPWKNHWGNGSGMPLYCNCTCKLSSTLLDSNVSANLVLSSKTNLEYNTQLSNFLDWKPVGAIDLFKSWKVHIISRCWNANNSSGKSLFLGRLQIVCCGDNEDVYLQVFEDKRVIQDSSVTAVYIFYLVVNICLQNIIHTALSILLLANLFNWKNESTACLTPHFLEENEILHLVSFHYWHKQKYTSELLIYLPFPKTQGRNFFRVLRTLQLEIYSLQLQ